MGATLNPGRRALVTLTLRGTKPDFSSRFSTLQSAHSPVRGHDELAVPLAVVEAICVLLTLPACAATDELDPVAGSDWRQLSSSAEMAVRTRASRVIG